MKKLLKKCDYIDLDFISEILDSYVSFTDDQKRKQLLKEVRRGKIEKEDELIALIDKQIRYYGSADVAYLMRSIFSDDPGVSAEEIVDDVAKSLKITIKGGASIEAKLEKIMKNQVENTLSDLKPEQLAESFRKMKLDNVKIDSLMDYLKSRGKALSLPVLLEFFGPQICQKVLLEVMLSLISKLVSKQVFTQLSKIAAQRLGGMPLGPIAWGISALVLAADMQAPAMRKIVPICLYLGVVGIRDGEEFEEIEVVNA